MSDSLNNDQFNLEEDIAIIGMSCRFPGADKLESFWQNLKNGAESVTSFSNEELKAAGVDPELIDNPNYVKASGIIEGIDLFDAHFFDYSPKEASMIDPQHRLFLEQAWEALEDAGYDPERYTGPIGVYAGVGMNTYLYRNLMSHEHLLREGGGYFAMIASDKDFLATRVSYKCNLTGPSITVQTACSTSLVAVHLACQSIRSGECDIALAGGVSLRIPQKAGYLYQEGIVLSPDGHCRAFDAKAGGTVIGNGAGVIVLKMFTDALADGDQIYAIIKGSALNNDGSLKAGFTAPSLDRQAAVIAEALAVSQVDPDSISYIETHGTGTPIGDPIEIKALTKTYNSNRARHSCAIGSVKTNIGHLDAAAGIAGIIKTALCLKHKQIPPSLNYQESNPQIDFEHSPFFVNTKLVNWETGDKPLRAGVSSFGIGGTNVHSILEEAPELQSSGSNREWQLVVLSGRNKKVLEDQSFQLQNYLQSNIDLNLADMAFTLQVGRKVFPQRLFFVCRDNEEAIEILNGTSKENAGITNYDEEKERPVAFIFVGAKGSLDIKGIELYKHEPCFRQIVDRCAELLRNKLQADLKQFLYPDLFTEQSRIQTPTPEMNQAALFTTEYALASLWMEWGVKPQALLGIDRLGEWLAACLAGVISLESALTAIIAGKVGTVKGVKLNVPQIPIVSGLKNAWLSEKEAIDPDYWDRPWDDNLTERLSILLKDNRLLKLQIGQYQNIKIECKDAQKADQPLVLTSFGDEFISSKNAIPELAMLLKTLGKLWSAGVSIDWNGFYKYEKRLRVSLPTYPFERERHWIDPVLQADIERISSVSETVTGQATLTYHQRPELTVKYVAPQNETERQLAAIWEDLIGIKPIGIYDDFFELGGHSLLATEIIFKVRDQLKIDIPMDNLFEQPTIANLSSYIDKFNVVTSKKEIEPSGEIREEGEL